MKNFKSKLQRLKIPTIDHDPHQSRLETQLKEKYFSNNAYKTKFRFATGFAVLMLLFSLALILKPQVALKVNAFAFDKEQTLIKEENQYISPIQSNKPDYTSINNPTIKKHIEPNRYNQDSAYLIRKYSSGDDDAVLVVSEFKKQEDNKLKPIIY